MADIVDADKVMAARHIARLGVLKKERSNWDEHWQDIADVTYPKRADFTVERSSGERRLQKIYDSTSVHANELLASGFHGMLTNPATTWASLLMADPSLNDDADVKQWLRDVRDIMFEEINDPKAGFSTAMHETYLDYGAFCTAVLFIGERKNRQGIRFNTRSLVESYIAENADGLVDTLYRRWKWPLRKAVEFWGADKLSEKSQKRIEKGKLDEMIEILHVIEPRKHIIPERRTADNLPFTSIFIEVGAKHKIMESGYHEQPFMAPRFSKSSSGEVYGRGPGVTTLPDVKMLNAMMKTTIKAAQKKVDPTILAEDDSIVGTFRSVPAGINYYRRNREKPVAFDTRGDIRLGEELMASVRARIRESFFIDQLQLQQGPQMTATEVLQRTEEKLRLMGPVLGRVQTELLGPMIERVFAILFRQGKFPDPPAILKDQEKIKIEYESPISRAQKQLEAGGILRTFDIMAVLIQSDPSVMDNFDGDAAFKHIGIDLHGINPKLFRSEPAVKKIRDAREQAQRQAFDLEMAQRSANVQATQANAAASGGGNV